MFTKKFIEGPFKGLVFRLQSHDDTSMVILEFYGGRRIEVPRSDYNRWAEADITATNS